VQKILISTGGTGGHVIPAKVIKEHLIDDNEIYYSTDIRGLKYLSFDTDKTIILDTPKFNLNIFFPYKIVKLIYLVIKATLFLKNEKINKVVSIGGYMSLPVIISAKILRLSIFLIEPNLFLGRGNKFFLNFANKIFCYSDKLFNFPKKHLHKLELIKPLVFKTFYNQKENKNRKDIFCFLITGGSQGAKIFDDIIRDVMSEISKSFTIKVIQQTSRENVNNLKNFYDSNNIENIIFNFEEKFIDLINISDLCITRSGATSLAEISYLKKPFIAIPLPTSKDNHQLRNAEFYEEKGCCWIFDQKKLNKENLLNFIEHLLNDKSQLIEKKKNLQKLNFENSWKYINQKLKKIINEN
tara:strand:+ start:96 stop:1160 length:1065 start_codon:yes stop_codon:yes gene_type:complete